MSRRNILVVTVTVVVVVAGLVVWFGRDDDVDATTSDAEMATASNEVPFSFDMPAWTRKLPKDAEVVVDSPYAVVRERTGVRVYELRTGAQRWHYLDSNLVTTSATAHFGRLAVVSKTDVHVFDLHSGELLTTVPVDGGPRTAVPFSDTFLVLSDGTDAYRMYWNDGEELWSKTPPGCATSTGIVAGGSDVTMVFSCGDSVVLKGLDPRAGGARWAQEVPNAEAPTAEPPVATLVPADAPALVTTKDNKVVAIDMVTGTVHPARPVAPAAELTSTYDGWCAYEPASVPLVRCQDATTGAELTRPYKVPREGDATPTVWLSSWGTDFRVASTTGTGLAVSAVDSNPTEVLPDTKDPKVIYYGPGALVVTARGTMTVYS